MYMYARVAAPRAREIELTPRRRRRSAVEDQDLVLHQGIEVLPHTVLTAHELLLACADG
eukprot:SAG31_NODE_18931_length_617_cov_1.461390_1_plen_58_part_01